MASTNWVNGINFYIISVLYNIICINSRHAFVSFIALFYYVLGNIRPSLRSTLRTIQLIACVTHVNLQKYGFQKVLQPFIDDANSLAEVCRK